MALTKEETKKVLESARRDEKDTGSSEVQIALLTEKIKKLTVHRTKNPHDYSSKRGRNILIARRQNLLRYLKKDDQAHYEAIVAKLGLKK